VLRVKKDGLNRCANPNCKKAIPINQQYCDDDCVLKHQKAREYYRIYYLNEKNGVTFPPRICKVAECQQEFNPTRKFQIYCCTKCKRISYREKIEFKVKPKIKSNIKVSISNLTSNKQTRLKSEAKKKLIAKQIEQKRIANLTPLQRCIAQYRIDNASDIKKQKNLSRITREREELIAVTQELPSWSIKQLQVDNDFYR
jgi:hypothetical protein